MLRRQLPAYSPLTASGLLAGVRRMGSRPRERLEALLADRYRARAVLLTGSGTQALTSALRAAAGEGPPSVALPAYACYDVVSAAVGVDARIVFYDVDPETLAPDLGSLAEACAVEPDAVVVAPLYGIPVNWDVVEETVGSDGALLVEDAAQGLGASWGGRPLGALGDLSVLSFGRGKGWTGGAGGALLIRARGERVAPPSGPATSNVSVGVLAAAQWILGRPWAYGLPARLPWLALGETEYHAPREPGAMTPLSASLALAHAELVERENEVRRRNAANVLRMLTESEAPGTIQRVVVPQGGVPGYLRLPVLVPGGISGLVDERRARELGVMPGYPRPLPELPAARSRALPGPPTPGAERLSRELVTVPVHGLLTGQDMARIVDLFAP